MRYVNINVLSGSDNTNVTGAKQDANQLVSASFHAYFGDSTAAGVFKIQASNDVANCQYNALANFTPTNWVDIPSQSANVTAGTSQLLTIANMSYRWVRAVYTASGAGVQTITTVADVAGSLNNKYFFLSAGNNGTNYYVWYDVDGGGVDPMVPGKTGIQVAISAGDSANDVATATASAIDASSDFAAPAPAANVITVTNSTAGPFVAASNSSGGTSPGFTFAVTTGGTSTVNVNMNALSI